MKFIDLLESRNGGDSIHISFTKYFCPVSLAHFHSVFEMIFIVRIKGLEQTRTKRNRICILRTPILDKCWFILFSPQSKKVKQFKKDREINGI